MKGKKRRQRGKLTAISLTTTCTDGLHLQSQRAQCTITIQWICMSRVELRWNDLCHVCGTTSGWRPHHRPPQATRMQTTLVCLRKKTDYDFLAFQIICAPRSAADALSRSYSIPAFGRLGTISLQAWPILLLPSHKLVSPRRGQGTDELRTSFLTLLSFKSGQMSVILPSPLRAW